MNVKWGAATAHIAAPFNTNKGKRMSLKKEKYGI
jgi:hypothetical protein